MFTFADLITRARHALQPTRRASNVPTCQRSNVPTLFLSLALLASLLAGCALGSGPAPVTQVVMVVTSTPLPTEWVVYVVATPTPVTATAVPPTATPTLTPLPTDTPLPSPTPTASSTPTVTPTPTITPTPSPLPPAVQISVADCASVTHERGRPVWATGHLVVPAGQYSFTAWQYALWLRTEMDDDSPKMTTLVPGGKNPSSMYFDGNTPRILDNKSAPLPWYQYGGQTIYVTTSRVKVTGIWEGDCKMSVERIDVVSR